MINVILLTLLAAVVVLRVFFFFPVRVRGSSMDPTLRDGDLMLVRRTRRFRRRDVVICHYPKRWRTKKMHLIRQQFVKRVIGLPGETVEIRDGLIYINGSLIREHYLDPNHNRHPRDLPLRKLGPQEYFVFGDNRDISHDSRRIGPIRANMLIGRVFYRFSLTDNVNEAL